MIEELQGHGGIYLTVVGIIFLVGSPIISSWWLRSGKSENEIGVMPFFLLWVAFMLGVVAVSHH